MLSRQRLERFIAEHDLPAAFAAAAAAHYLPLADWLSRQCGPRPPPLVGINGAQGTGKTTLAALLALALDAHGRNAAVLSLDDFYLTAAARARLANDVHPLLQTRGVPGTHDLALLDDTLQGIATLGAGSELRVPRFDKSLDERLPDARWPALAGPVDLVLLEGWCVGSRPQADAALAEPISAFERRHDADGAFRHYVNAQLAGPYAARFARIDCLVMLAAPDFDAVFRWRVEQEQKLARTVPRDAPGLMSRERIAGFIEYFERVTRASLRALPPVADVVLELDARHACVRSRYRQ